MRRWLPWLALLLVVAVALGVGAGDGGSPPTEAERAGAIAESLRCPTCRGQAVADSDAPAAAAIRAEIGRRVEAGQSDAEIKRALVNAYGEGLLLNPPRSGVAGLVWVLPVAGLVLAIAGLVVAFRRWRPDEVTVDDADRAVVERARMGERRPGVADAG